MSELKINQVDVAKLAVGPGEILMVIVDRDRPVSREMAARIQNAFREAFKQSGASMPGILLADDVELKVVRKEEAPQ